MSNLHKAPEEVGAGVSDDPLLRMRERGIAGVGIQQKSWESDV